MFRAIFRVFDFSGRSSRWEYWCYLIGLAVLGVIAGVAIAAVTDGHPGTRLILDDQTDALIGLGVLVLCFPHLALIVRRFHDFGWSGWALLLLAVPVVNIVMLLMLMFRGSAVAAEPYAAPPITIYNTPSAGVAASRTTHVDEIARLADLHARGMLSAPEFAAAKAQILRN